MNIEQSIEILKEFKKTGFHTLMIKYNEDRIHINKLIEEAIETLLTAYEKEKEKNKELESYCNDVRKEMNEENRRCMLLAVENQDLKEKNKKYLVNLTHEQYIKLVEQIRSEINKEWKDVIKAKIEEVKDGTFDAKIVLQSLLEKE